MNMMETTTRTETKSELRQNLRRLRASIPAHRKEEASTAALKSLLALLQGKRNILSFASFGDEIDLWPLNKILAQEGRLLLPKMEGDHLQPYRVRDVQAGLDTHVFGIQEPRPECCEAVPLDVIDFVLVPGLGFDKQHHRIGYGKGFYDLFLRKLPPHINAGIGFHEQLLSSALPVTNNDHTLAAVYTF